MKIILIGEPKIIMNNPHSKHNYFGWPTATRLQNGKIAVVASGYRLRHVCPFGKTVISYSEDDGETYTISAPVIDTPLDDRDGGILAYGDKNVIVTSFNNTVEVQRARKSATPYVHAYLDMVTPEEEAKYLGTTYRVSHDCGVTFGPIHRSPVSSPHGPLEMPDGSLLWIGRLSDDGGRTDENDGIYAYRIDPENGTSELVGKIDNVEPENGVQPLSCEPHTILLEDGRLLTHIRLQTQEKDRMFTIYQSESSDGGKTWTKPYPIIGRADGAPPHLFRHSSGMLICTYAYREAPTAIRAMFSTDNGATWDTNYPIYVTPYSQAFTVPESGHMSDSSTVAWDIGYPSTVETRDGSLITIFYAHPSENEPAVIMQQKWRFEQ